MKTRIGGAVVDDLRETPVPAPTLNDLAEKVHATARSKGWYEDEAGNPVERNFGEVVALMHSELSEALEAWRIGNPPSAKIPAFSAVEEEFADVLIRVLDTAKAHGFDLDGAVAAKDAYNARRPYRHGGKKC